MFMSGAQKILIKSLIMNRTPPKSMCFMLFQKERKVYMKTNTVNIYLYILVKWLCGFVFHHNGAPPYFHWEVWWYLDNALPWWWMSEAWNQRRLNVVFLNSHVAGSDIMPLPSVWLHDGYCVCTTISTHIPDLELRITEAVSVTGVSDRHLPCDLWGSHQMSVKLVRNFERFSSYL